MLEGPLETHSGALTFMIEGAYEPFEHFFNVCFLIFA
jgi:hypothetical protein